MKIVTGEPAGILEPARGCCSTTSPSLDWSAVGRFNTATLKPASCRVWTAAAWSWPTILGTAVFGWGFGPVETLTRTREPGFNVVPALGDCEMTLFAG